MNQPWSPTSCARTLLLGLPLQVSFKSSETKSNDPEHRPGCGRVKLASLRNPLLRIGRPAARSVSKGRQASLRSGHPRSPGTDRTCITMRVHLGRDAPVAAWLRRRYRTSEALALSCEV